MDVFFYFRPMRTSRGRRRRDYGYGGGADYAGGGFYDAGLYGGGYGSVYGGAQQYEVSPSPLFLAIYICIFIDFNKALYYWVLPGFTGFYWVLLGFTGFYWVLLGFTGFYRVLLGFTGFYLGKPEYTGFSQVLPGFADLYFNIYRVLSGFYRVLPGFDLFCLRVFL